MRSHSQFVLFLVCLCTVQGYERQNRGKGEDNGTESDDNRNCNDENCNNDGNCNGENSGTEICDDKKYFYEPCDYVDDVDCVRKFFKDHAKCSVIEHEDHKPVYRARHVAYLPKTNLTLVTTKVRLTKLNGTIITFYINKKTSNLVMTVDFEGVDIVSKKAYFIVSRRGKEPVVVADYANGTHPLTATAIIPLIDDQISIKETIVTSYLPNPFPDFYFGRKVTTNKDPDFAASIAGVYADVPTAAKEFFLTEGPSFFLAYLQKYICDFGLPLSD